MDTRAKDGPVRNQLGVGVVAPTVCGGPPFSRTGNDRVEAEALVACRMVAFGMRDHKDATDLVVHSVAGRVSHSLRAEGFDGSEDGTGRGTPIVAFGSQNSASQGLSVGPISPTMDKSKVPALAFAENMRGELRLEGGDGQRSGALSTGGGRPGQGRVTITAGNSVRRLTPMECERLQGFPDNYTLLPGDWRPRRKEDHIETVTYLTAMGFTRDEAEALADCPDGHRYKALGNSMAVPVMRWLGERIARVTSVMRYNQPQQENGR